MDETILYVTLEVTLKEGADPDAVKNDMVHTLEHEGISSSEIVDVEMGG